MTDDTALTPEVAMRIYDVLVEHAGASPDYWRENFVHAQSTSYCPEYRFQGALGFGGKFRRQDPRFGQQWYVDAYVEDEKRAGVKDKIDATNASLRDLLQELTVPM